VEPPYKPKVSKIYEESTAYANFEAMMKDLGKESWLSDVPRYRDQVYFENWDYASPKVLRVEYGIANEMEQYDRNFKVRQLMGSKGSGSGSESKKL
jgi:hypothetical protein